MMLQGVPPLPPTPPGHPFDPNLMPPGVFLAVAIAALAAGVIILWPIMRAFGRRLEGKGSGDQALRAEVDQLHARIGEVDMLQARVAELEERLDFAERLLAQAQQPARLGAPTEESGR